MYRITEEDVISQKNKIYNIWQLEIVNRISEEYLNRKAFSILSDEGAKSLLIYMYNRISFLSSSAIKQLINNRLKKINIAYAMLPQLAEKDEIQDCEQQVADVLNENYEKVFSEETPLFLGRLNLILEKTMSAFEDMFTNIYEYRKDISEKLLNVSDLGLINKIEGDVRKSNGGGHNTFILTATNGIFVYKNRDSRIDEWAQIIFDKYFSEWIIIPKCVVVKDCFGFFEYIQNQPAETLEDAKKFFYNMGVLSAVLQMFGSADFHRNNILVQKTYPVPIDMEMILLPKTYESVSKSVFETNNKEGYERDLDYSVMQLSIQPFVTKDGTDIGTLTGKEKNPITPLINGQKYNVKDFEEDYFNGFEDGYRTCMAISPDLLKDIDTISEYTLRRSFRSNDYYFYRFSTYIAGKSSNTHVRGTQYKGKDLFEKYESKCIEKADIPYFITTASSKDLISGNKDLLSPNFYYNSAIESFETRVKRMSQEEMQFEERLLRALLSMDFTKSVEPVHGDDIHVSRQEAIINAKSVLHQLDINALVSPCKELFWIQYLPILGLIVTNASLYRGHMGIALFSAACYSVFTDEENISLANRLCRECMKTVERLINYWDENFPLKECIDFDEVNEFLEALRLVGIYLKEDKYIKMYERLYKKFIGDDQTDRQPIDFKITKCNISTFNPSFRYGDVGAAYEMLRKAFIGETKC